MFLNRTRELGYLDDRYRFRRAEIVALRTTTSGQDRTSL